MQGHKIRKVAEIRRIANMCTFCPPSKGYDYSSAYRSTAGVEMKTSMSCPKCGQRVQASTVIHVGSECWDPWLACKCGWSTYVRIGPVNIHPAKVAE